MTFIIIFCTEANSRSHFAALRTAASLLSSGSADSLESLRPGSLTGSITKMNAAAKLLSAMRRNSLDWQIADLQAIAKRQGLEWRHQKSSHCIFVRDDGKTLSVPAHRPIKPIYIRKFIELIDGT